MIPVVWTPQAVEDVEAIRDFIARDSARYAAVRVVPELQNEMLRERPWEVPWDGQLALVLRPGRDCGLSASHGQE